jgi:hypothetical protein
MSIFSDWQKKYASHGIATFPVRITPDRKQPAISHYGRVGLQGSALFQLSGGQGPGRREPTKQCSPADRTA